MTNEVSIHEVLVVAEVEYLVRVEAPERATRDDIASSAVSAWCAGERTELPALKNPRVVSVIKRRVA